VTADLLRRAAAKLREHATPIQPCVPAGSWCPEYAHAAIRHVERNVELDLDPCPDHGDVHGTFSRYAGRYVALMHPPVALALADLLELAADRSTLVPADAFEGVARAVLREAEGGAR
jgi:hypothetical protein